MAQNRTITGRFGPKTQPKDGVKETDSKGLFGLMVDQALRGRAYRSGSNHTPEYWVRVQVDGQHQHRTRWESVDYYLHWDAEGRFRIRADGQKFRLERFTAAEAFTIWAWDGADSLKGMNPFFQTYGIRVVRYGVPRTDDPEKDERQWWQFTFRDDSVAYLEPTQTLKQVRIQASLQLSPITAREIAAGRHMERARFTPKPEAAPVKA